MATRFETADLIETARLTTLLLPSVALPERYLARLCGALGRLDAGRSRGGPGPALAATVEWDAPELAAAIAANQYELRAQVLRSYRPAGWKPEVRIEGLRTLEAALEAGNGAVLWVGHFVFHGLVFEFAMHRAGYPLVHVSRREHGFSKTRFGMAILNPIRTHIEERYLKKRIVLNETSRYALMKQLIRHIGYNDVVSLTVGAWEGAQTISVPVLGQSYDVASGAVSAARSAEAPLIPVFPVKEPGSQGFTIYIEHPLHVPYGKDRRVLRDEIAGEYGPMLERYVTSYPDQWRGWKYLYPRQPGHSVGAAFDPPCSKGRTV